MPAAQYAPTGPQSLSVGDVADIIADVDRPTRHPQRHRR